MFAAGAGLTDCVRLLIDVGADKDAQNNVLVGRGGAVMPFCHISCNLPFVLTCLSLLHFASYLWKCSHFIYSQWRLFSLGGGKFESQGGQTALTWASMEGRADCVQLLIDAGVDKDIMDNVRVGCCFAFETSGFNLRFSANVTFQFL